MRGDGSGGCCCCGGGLDSHLVGGKAAGTGLGDLPRHILKNKQNPRQCLGTDLRLEREGGG